MSYATQRYDGGNTAALRTVTDGSRNAGAIYGIDTFTITPAVTLTYGARYSRYDYLSDRSRVSPRVALTVVPANHLTISTPGASRGGFPAAVRHGYLAAAAAHLLAARSDATVDRRAHDARRGRGRARFRRRRHRDVPRLPPARRRSARHDVRRADAGRAGDRHR